MTAVNPALASTKYAVAGAASYPRILNVFFQKARYAQQAAESTTAAPSSDELSDEEQLLRMRNISRLAESNRRKLNGMTPYVEAIDAHHQTLAWKRKQVGKYGLDCGVDPAICFATVEEMAEMREYEKVAFDKSWVEIRENARLERAEKEKERKLREERAIENLRKCEVWKAEIRERMEKKATEQMEAKRKRERLLEEVRRHFGYTIDTRDEKFQIMLEFKEEEQKKQAKLAKKQKKEEILMKKLASLEAAPGPSDGAKKGEAAESGDGK